MRDTDKLIPNEGIIDRALRIGIGAFVVSLLYWGPETFWALFGLIPLITGITGVSPLYRRMGWSTVKRTPPRGPAATASGA